MKSASVGLGGFPGLFKALSSGAEIHSYTLDLGFALGLLEQCKGSHLFEFQVDSSGYRPASLPSEEWYRIAGSHRFKVTPRSKRPRLFHSKAWLFKVGAMFGSCNLSIREARDNLNFWAWIPEEKGREVANRLARNLSCTVCRDLDSGRSCLRGAPLASLKRSLGDAKISALVIATPQPPNRKLLQSLSPYLKKEGECSLFLNVDGHAISALPKRGDWIVRSFVPNDPSIRLHGKMLYAEWVDGNNSGAVLYVGSANFTWSAYSDRNVESGVLLKTQTHKQMGMLRRALAALLGKCKQPSRAHVAWATERFDGRWRRAAPADKNGTANSYSGLSKEESDRSAFIDALRATRNRLRFSGKYGGTRIVTASLTLSGGDARHWRHPAPRAFHGVVWVPTATMKLKLQGGRGVAVSVPPLEGLMAGAEKGPGLVELLLSPAAAGSNSGTGEHRPVVLGRDPYIYSDPRVLFPWRPLIQSGHADLLGDRHEVQRALDSISGLLKEVQPGTAIARKLTVLSYCLKGLLDASR